MAAPTLEERYRRAEQKLEVGKVRRVRRTPAVVVGIIGALTLAVGLTAATDLRRLQSPRGASLAWTESAVFGDCRAFVALSRPVDPTTERRTESQLCRALRTRTADARASSTRIRITGLRVQQQNDTATAVVRVVRPNGAVDARLSLVREGDDWRVLRDATACDAVGCP
ncbi:MAG: hypothetical protein LC779_15695 [Actinobacteria bacterium]|nr:hypothetical protein [Actinomycetota bacterium]